MTHLGATAMRPYYVLNLYGAAARNAELAATIPAIATRPFSGESRLSTGTTLWMFATRRDRDRCLRFALRFAADRGLDAGEIV